MGRTRYFRYGELPLVILFLLEDESLRGFDVMAELDRRFGPDYRASAGTVYPALAALEGEGLIARSTVDPQRYELTSVGRTSLDARRTMLSAIENRTGVRLHSRDDLHAALQRFTSRIAPLAGRVDVIDVEHILDGAADSIARLLDHPGGTRATTRARRSV